MPKLFLKPFSSTREADQTSTYLFKGKRRKLNVLSQLSYVFHNIILTYGDICEMCTPKLFFSERYFPLLMMQRRQGTWFYQGKHRK